MTKASAHEQAFQALRRAQDSHAAIGGKVAHVAGDHGAARRQGRGDEGCVVGIRQLASQGYFKVLKSGCGIEKLQLETLERLEPALAFYLTIAWRVLYLTLLGRNCPEMPCNAVFAEEEWCAVCIVTKRQPP